MRLLAFVLTTILLIFPASASGDNLPYTKDWRDAFVGVNINVTLPKTNNLPEFNLSIIAKNLSDFEPDQINWMSEEFYNLLAGTSDSEAFRWNWGINSDHSYESLKISFEQKSIKFSQLVKCNYSQIFFIYDRDVKKYIGTISIRQRKAIPEKDHPLHKYYLKRLKCNGVLCNLGCTLIPSYRKKGIVKRSISYLIQQLSFILDRDKIWMYIATDKDHPAVHNIIFNRSQRCGFIKCSEASTSVVKYFPLENGSHIDFTKECFYYVREPRLSSVNNTSFNDLNNLSQTYQ